MKRLISLFLALLLALSLAACAVSEKSEGADAGTAELVILPSDNAPEDISAPDAQTDEADAQAPPETQDTQSTEQPAPAEAPSPEVELPMDEPEPTLDEHGTYDSKEDVALFIHLYGRLPDNYLTKKEAEALGWSGGSLEQYAPGKCIGGSRFGNYEGLLPDAKGRKYTECDIDTLGAKGRGAKRIVFSNDGLIYYTGDHYKTFELLYGEE